MEIGARARGSRSNSSQNADLEDILTTNKLSTAPVTLDTKPPVPAPEPDKRPNADDWLHMFQAIHMPDPPAAPHARRHPRPSPGRTMLPPITPQERSSNSTFRRSSSASLGPDQPARPVSQTTTTALAIRAQLQRRWPNAGQVLTDCPAPLQRAASTNSPSTSGIEGRKRPPLLSALPHQTKASRAATNSLRHATSAPGPLNSLRPTQLAAATKAAAGQLPARSAAPAAAAEPVTSQSAGQMPRWRHSDLLAAPHIAATMMPPSSGSVTGQGAPLPGELVFDSEFEGGNLGQVKRLGDGMEYELTLRPDTLNSRYRLWFHFCVSNTHPGQQVIFTITNFCKVRSLFRHGMSPVVRCTSRPQWCRVPARNTFYYKASKQSRQYLLSFAFVFDSPSDTYEFAYSFPFTYTFLQRELDALDRRQLPFLRRQLLVRSPQLRRVDLLCISDPMLPCPLTSSARSSHRTAPSSQVSGTAQSITQHSTGSPSGNTTASTILVTSKLGATDMAGGASNTSTASCPAQAASTCDKQQGHGLESSTEARGSGWTVTVPGDRPASASGERAGLEAYNSRGMEADVGGTTGQRPVVCVTGRVHPGETPASWLVQGLINFLLSQEPEAQQLRRIVTFVITPMLNPDGVFAGNYRTDAGGVDLNRMWALAPATQGGTLPALHSQLSLLEAYQQSSDFQVDLFIDVHAHSTSRQSFMFCNRPPASDPGQQLASSPPAAATGGEGPQGAAAEDMAQEVTQTQAALDRIIRLPRLLESVMPGFSLSCCVFDDDKAKEGCARRAVGQLLPSCLCYTLEVSMFHAAPDVVVLTSPGQPLPVAFNNTLEGYLEMGRQLGLAIGELYGVIGCGARSSGGATDSGAGAGL